MEQRAGPGQAPIPMVDHIQERAQGICGEESLEDGLLAEPIAVLEEEELCEWEGPGEGIVGWGVVQDLWAGLAAPVPGC